MDAAYIGKLERGEYRWPNQRYRAALQTATDADLCFTTVRRLVADPRGPSTAEKS